MIVGVSVSDDETEVRLIVVNHHEEVAVDLKPEYAKKLAARILVTAFGLEDNRGQKVNDEASVRRWPRCSICGETRINRHACNDDWHR